MSGETLLILNPASGAGRTGRRREAILDRVAARLGPVEVATTGGRGDATTIARAATQRGVDRLLVAGGDGTTSEVVHGMLDAADALPPAPRLGLLPLGSGRDLARSLGLPRRLPGALDVIAADHVQTIDAGRLEHRDASGRPSRRHFVNEASAGLSGATVARVGRLAKRVGPGVAFAVGAISAILSHRPVEVAVEIDGVRQYEGPVSLIVAANGRSFGAGMQVAPGARLDDGLLEIVLVRGLTVPRLLSNLPSLYRGRHGGHPAVSFHAARTLEVLPKALAAPIDLDGESAGELPMRAEILPGALRVFVDPERVRSGTGEGRNRMREE